MIHILKKNAGFFLIYLAALLSLMTLWWVSSSSGFNLGKIMFQGLWMIVITLGCISVSEQSEFKSDGYSFMKTLPILDKELIRAKFLLVFLTVTALIAYSLFLHMLKSTPGPNQEFSHIFLLFCGSAALVISGFMFYIIFRLGYSLFMKISWVMIVGLFVIPIGLIELVFLKMKVDWAEIIRSILEVPRGTWLALPALSLALFAGLERATLRAKQRQIG
jgi:hypothetical protein